MWNDCMIDVESFSLDENAALVGLGCAFFDLQTCTIGPTFSQTIHLATSVALGGRIDASTCLWWLGQSEAIRNQVRFQGRDVRLVMTDFCEWMREHSDPTTVRVYGNSDAFDIGKMERHLKWLGMEPPWFWTNRRCFRTIRNLYPQVKYDPSQKNGEAHDPLVDAVFQVEHLFKIKNRHAR